MHDRPRVCAAVIENDHILMVRHSSPERTYWTLPGGGVEPGETHLQAVQREVLEETCLEVRVGRLLFVAPYIYGACYCYLAERVDLTMEARTGGDPEDADLPPESRLIQGVGWQRVEAVKADRQVSKVLLALQSPDHLVFEKEI